MRAMMIAGLMVLSGCDAGPSAVVGDGQGQSPTQTAARPEAAPPQPEAFKAKASATAATGATATPDAAPEAAAPPHMGEALPLPSGPRAEVSETAYGDWPLWSKSRKYSADDNAHYQFARHGAEIGATSYADFLAMTHGFVHNPPKGVQTLKRRNGDTLFYDPRRNIFAVMTKQGAPRILFRPREGGDYWEQQKVIEASGGWRPNAGDAG
jgi:pyocin large subunit-like protein